MDEQRYNEGYKTGKNWKDSYIPGGPFDHDDESKRLRKIWLEGFHDGLEVNRYKNTDNIKKLLGS